MIVIAPLIDEDGRAVMQPESTDGLPVQVNGHFEARRQPGMTPGTDINVPMSFNIVPTWVVYFALMSAIRAEGSR